MVEVARKFWQIYLHSSGVQVENRYRLWHDESRGIQVNRQREVSERFKVQSWKGCVGAIPPWVRIPSSLFFYLIWFNLGVAI